MDDRSKPLLFIISGPAGSGKTTLCHRLLSEFTNLRRAVTATTRSPREGEKDGHDYYFLTREEFEEQKKDGAFLENALVHGRAYGTLREEIISHFDAGEDVLLSIDVQGMRQVREKSLSADWLRGHLVTVFIKPRTLDELRERLRRRGTDDDAEIERRIESARVEIAAALEFDYILLTGSREEDFDRARAIYLAEKMRPR